jgi:hypothetical protein
MSTNFFLTSEPCPHCQRADNPIHIGNSASGWTFLLQSIPDDGLTSWTDWKARIERPGARVVDEYGDQHEAADFIRRVEAMKDQRDPGLGFLDADGFALFAGEFS